MGQHTIEKNERIAKPKGTMMVVVAVIFDLMPFLLLIMAVFLFFQGISETGFFGKILIIFVGFTALGAAIVVGPVIYLIFSFVNVLVAYLFFWTWFILNGVNIFSLQKPKKFTVSVLTAFFEAIPFVNLLPSITIMVVYNVRHAQKEDKREHERSLKEMQRRISVATGV